MNSFKTNHDRAPTLATGQGERSDRIWHPIKHTGQRPDHLRLYSTDFHKKWRVLWELAPGFSVEKGTWTDMIRVWSISKHTEYERSIKAVIVRHREGRTCQPGEHVSIYLFDSA